MKLELAVLAIELEDEPELEQKHSLASGVAAALGFVLALVLALMRRQRSEA